jgi:hypothetical protein
MNTSVFQAATSLDAWRTYVDPEMAFSDEEFDAMSIDERIAHITEMDEIIPTVDDILNQTAVGCGWHDWPTEGGTIRVSTEQLRPALEAAYDCTTAAWPSMVEID